MEGGKENGVGRVVRVELLQLCEAWVLRIICVYVYMCIWWGAGYCEFQMYSVRLASW